MGNWGYLTPKSVELWAPTSYTIPNDSTRRTHQLKELDPLRWSQVQVPAFGVFFGVGTDWHFQSSMKGWTYPVVLLFALTKKTGPKWLKHDWTIQSSQSWKLKMKTGWMNHISPKPQINIKFLKQWGSLRRIPLLPYPLRMRSRNVTFRWIWTFLVRRSITCIT